MDACDGRLLMRIFAAILALSAITADAAAQSPFRLRELDRASTIDWIGGAVTESGDRKAAEIYLQSNRIVRRTRPLDRSFARTAELPEGAFLFDVCPPGPTFPEGAVFAVTGEGVEIRAFAAPGTAGAETVRLPLGDALFNGTLTAAPFAFSMRIPDLATDPQFLVPGKKSIRLIGAGEKGELKVISETPYAVETIPTLGWGLGYRMESRLSPSWYDIADVDGDGRSDIIGKSGARLWVARRKEAGFAAVEAYGPAPTREKPSILDFDHRVPPLVLDGAGPSAGLLLTDPGTGTTIIYRGEGRPGPRGEAQPDDVSTTSGWSLARALIRTSASAKDLLVMSVPALNFVEQVQVVRKNVCPLTITLRPADGKGGFKTARGEMLRADMPITLALTRNRRTVRFRAPVFGLWSADDAFLVAPGAKGSIDIHRLGKDGAEKVQALDWAIADHAALRDPFLPLELDLNGDGRTEACLLIQDPDGDDRVVVLESNG